MIPEPAVRIEVINLGFQLLGYTLGAVVLIGSVFEIRYLLRRGTPRADWVFALISIGSLAAMSLMMCTHPWYGLGLHSLLLLPVVLATAFAQVHSRLGDARQIKMHLSATRDELRLKALEISQLRDREFTDVEETEPVTLSAGDDDVKIDGNDG